METPIIRFAILRWCGIARQGLPSVVDSWGFGANGAWFVNGCFCFSLSLLSETLKNAVQVQFMIVHLV